MNRDEQIAVLKEKLRKQYAQYQAFKPDYSCGHELSKHISTDYSEACRALNSILNDLALLDPNTPTTRF